MTLEEILQAQIEGTLQCPRCGSIIAQVEWYNTIPWGHCENENIDICLGDEGEQIGSC